MAITTFDLLIAALGAGNVQSQLWHKEPALTTVAGNWSTLWTTPGTPNAGVNPSSLAGAICDNTVAGGIAYTTPSGTAYLASAAAGGATQNTVALYDRLWHAGAISTTTTSTQTFTTTLAPTRYNTVDTTSVGNGFFVEVTTATTGTTYVLSISYTNQHNTSGRTATVSIPAAVAGRVFFVALQAGDTGVMAVASCAMATGNTAGVLNLVMYNSAQFNMIPYLANLETERDYVLQLANMPVVQSAAHLAMLIFCSTTTAGNLFGKTTIVNG